MEAELDPLIDFSRLEYVFVIVREDLREEDPETSDDLQSVQSADLQPGDGND
jgi:cell shape-determining protein MreC